MKLSIRWKLMLFVAGISLAVTIVLAYATYSFSYKKLYNNFLFNKLIQIKTIALSINGDVHKTLTANSDTLNPEYRRLQNYLHKLKMSDKNISYLYTLNYDSINRSFTYCIDGDNSENNIFWIETSFFTIKIHFLETTNHRTNRRIDNQQLCTVLHLDSFSILFDDVILNIEERELEKLIKIDDKEIDAYFTLSLKDEPLSIPGDLFKETSEGEKEYIKIMESGRDYLKNKLDNGIYGQSLSVNAIIKDSKNRNIGLACLEVYEHELKEFQIEFQRISIIITLLSVIFIIVTLPLLLEYFVVQKIKLINSGIKAIFKNKLDTKIKITIQEKFKNFALGFNNMTTQLKSFYEDLEGMIRMRTMEIEQQKEEISIQSNCLREANKLLIEKNNEIETQKRKIESQNETLYKINEELTTSEQNLKQIVKTKDKLFSIIAHDLRSPFSALVGLTEVLATQPNQLTDKEISVYSNFIHTSANRLLNLIENLLFWSRSQTGNLKLIYKNIKLLKIVKEIVDINSIQANTKNITIETSIDNQLTVYADKDALSTIIRNLLSNAIKYTYNKGTIKIYAQQKNSEIIISITDNGVGMSHEMAAKLFKFEESFTTRGTNMESGTGLGLIICKEFVEYNGGKIWVESELNKGTTFHFSIPSTSKENI